MAKKPENFIPYKEKELKMYASNEYMADNQRRYRAVYDQSETTYLWAEYSFYNKLFDEYDWEFACQFKAFNSANQLLCDLPLLKTISKDQNIVYVREGWGMDTPGIFWKKGSYRWEVWLKSTTNEHGEKSTEPEHKIAETTFHITDAGCVTEEENPYMVLRSIKLYEGPLVDVKPDQRHYQKVFNRDTTRYVWAEFEADNLLKDKDSFPCELFFNFYSNTGYLKGSVHELLYLDKDKDKIRCTIGWGAEEIGSWFHDDYHLEVVFMDRIIAVVPFTIGTEDVESTGTQHLLPGGMLSMPTFKPDESLDETLARLDGMIGLSSIKARMREYTSYLNFLKLRREKGIEETQVINLHTVFIGNPGTGKTTVAMMLGQIYKNMGLLTRGHVHEVDRAELVGEFIGQTAPKVKKAIQQAHGGILFIDEAYSLARKNDDNKDFGREVIEILLKELSDGEGNLAVVVAGYPEEMKTFLESNPGLKSRFSQTFQFPDYTPQELLSIAEYAAERRRVTLDPAAKNRLYKHLVSAYRDRDKAFGNARLVNQLLDAAKMNMGLRLMQQPDVAGLAQEDLITIQVQDIEKIFQTGTQKGVELPIDETLLSISLQELNQLVGLEGVKKEIEELVQLVNFYHEIGKDIRQEFSLHAVFTGNPGTGKTTVARILANIFKALGILERGHLVECDRQKLVAGYLGQTAEKTAQLIQQARGGVLFIDEAYMLNEGESDTFGKEAVATLLKQMEDIRGELIVIAAGYPDDMRRFLNSNHGLKSRFDRTFTFADFQPAELYQIAELELKAEGLEADAEAAAHLKDYFEVLYGKRDAYFGNGREVRKVIEKVIKNQHLRLSRIPASTRTAEVIRKLTLGDVAEFNETQLAQLEDNRSARVGFRQGGAASAG